MGNDWMIWGLFILIVIFLVWNYTRRRKSGGMNLDVAIGILSNVEDCIRTIEVRRVDPLSKQKFQNASWRAFGKKATFLKPETIAALNEGFTMVEDFNQQIDAARKNKMMEPLRDMPVDKLKGPMLKAKEGLAAYIKTGNQDDLKNRRGCLGF